MGKPEKERLMQKRQKLLEQMIERQDMIRGSLVKTTKKCGRKGCRCEKGEKHPHVYLSFSGKEGNTIVYVAKEQEAAFRQGISSYRKAWELLEKISRMNIEIIKGGQDNG